MRRVLLVALTLLALAVVGAVSGASAAIHLDRSFGRDGLVVMPGKKVPHLASREAVAIEPGGGLILATNRTVQRLDPSGHLDRDFGKGGTVTPPRLVGGTFYITGAAVDGKGRIVVVGTSRPQQPKSKPVPLQVNAISELYEPAYTAARILRYLPSGRLDKTFGVGGIVETDFGLPTPEVEGVKLASRPVVETTGVAVDGAGRVIVTGGAAEGAIVTSCFHDDYYPGVKYASFVGRLTQSGHLDASFGGGDSVFGGRSASENPLGLEDAAYPVITPNDGVIFQRGGFGHCPRQAGGLGFVQLTSAGNVFGGSEPDARWRVFDATAAPDGSVVLLLAPRKGSEAPERVVRLRPDGSVDRSFGHEGKVVLRLPEESYASRVGVDRDGKVLVQGVKGPRFRPGESEKHWWSRFSIMLIGLRADGSRDIRVGPHGTITKHIPHYYEGGGFWLDEQDRPTVTASYLPKGGPLGFAAVRFTPAG